MTANKPVRPEAKPSVARMTPYVPGEQPPGTRLIKLNTNENPYPPAPEVLEALHGLDPEAVRKYPNPTCESLRASLARDLAIDPNQIIVTNGSDEVLKMFIEAYVEKNQRVAYLWPTYSLYPVFVEEAAGTEVRLDWSPGGRSQEEALRALPSNARVVFIANPNPPHGLGVDLNGIRELALAKPGTLVVVDEAYIAYGSQSAIALVQEGLENVAVTRTFSKSHSLAGLRVGFGAGPQHIIETLYRIKDSYNVNAASQAAARAGWDARAYTDDMISRIRETRQQTFQRLRERGFSVSPSEGNFLFARRPDAREVFGYLRDQGVLVRYFDTPELREGIRITIGTPEQMERFFAALMAYEGVPHL